MSSPEELAELEAAVKAGAQKVDAGHFRIDAQRALAKLRDHRLAEPHHYILELLRAAVAASATAVTLKIDANDVELAFDGEGVEPAAMKDLLSRALAPGKDEASRRTRLLALGVAGALGVKPKFVKVTSGGVEVELTPPAQVSVRAVRKTSGTTVHVRGRMGYWVLRNAMLGAREAEAVREHARHFPVRLTLNGERLEGPVQFGREVLAQAEARGNGLHLVAAVPAKPLAQSEVRFNLFGVDVVTRRLRHPDLALVAWVRHDGFLRNASGSDLVETDPSLQLALSRLEDLTEELVRTLVARQREGDVPAIRERLIDLLLRVSSSASPSMRQVVLRQQLEGAPLVVGPAGELCSVAALRKEVKEGRSLRFATLRYPAESYTQPAILLPSPLDSLLPSRPRVDVRFEAEQRRAAVEHRARWERELPEEPRLDPRGLLASATFAGARVEGEVGLSRHQLISNVRMLYEGRLLFQVGCEALAPLRLRAVVNLKGPLPQDAWQKNPNLALLAKVLPAVRAAAQTAVLQQLPALAPPLASGSGMREAPPLGPQARRREVAQSDGRREPKLVGEAPPLASSAVAQSDGRLEPKLVAEAPPLASSVAPQARSREVAHSHARLEPASEDAERSGLRQASEALPPLDYASLRAATLEANGEACGGEARGGAPSALQPRDLPELRAHGRDLLGALAAQGQKRHQVPPALSTALLFPCVGGGHASLEEIARQSVCRFVASPQPDPLLDGTPAFVLTVDDRHALRTLLENRELEDVERRLYREREVRARLKGKKQHPQLPSPATVTVTFDEDGVRGLVGLPMEPHSGLALSLLRDGVWLETTQETARYQVALAAVECPALAPDEEWAHAKRDRAFQRVMDVVRSAERSLCGALLKARRGELLDELLSSERRYLRAFLQKELQAFPRQPALDELQRAAVEAALFQGAHGRLSLAQLAASVREGRFWALESCSMNLPPELTVLLASSELTGRVEALLGATAESPVQEVARLDRRSRLRLTPAYSEALGGSELLQTAVAGEGLSGQAAFNPRGTDARVALLLEERLWQRVALPAWLPLEATVSVAPGAADLADEEVSPALREALASALAAAQRSLLELAQGSPLDDEAREVMCRALGERVDDALAPEAAQALGECPLLLCTDGARWPLSQVEGRRIGFVTEPLRGTPSSGGPLLVAGDSLTRMAMRRWRHGLKDLTESFKAELMHEALTPVRKVEVGANALLRRDFERPGVKGQVALVPGAGRRLELYRAQRPVLTLTETGFPPGLSAAVDCEELGLLTTVKDAAEDPAVAKVVRWVLEETLALLEELASRWPSLPVGQQELLRPQLLRVLAEEGKYRALRELPLLQTANGGTLSFRQLAQEHAKGRPVRWSSEPGTLSGLVWLPREWELEATSAAGWVLLDVTRQQRALKLRAGRAVESLCSPLESTWRAEVRGSGLAGELALPAEPSGQLRLQLVRDGVLVEELSLPHPVGAVARVEGKELTVSDDWTKVSRNPAFRRMREAVEAALEAALAALLTQGTKEDPLWREYLKAAVRWRRTGPLAEAMAALPLFQTLEGAPVSLGAALAEHSRRKRLAVAAAQEASDGPPAPMAGARWVLAAQPGDVELLSAMGLAVEDVTQERARDRAREASRRARALQRLSYDGEALVRLRVDALGLRGELALPAELQADAAVVLSREGVAVERLTVAPGVAGAVDAPDVPVADDWTSARVSPALRRALESEVDRLFAALAAERALAAGRRPAAAAYALRYLSAQGMRAAPHLDALGPVASALTVAKWFRTCDGRWVDLRSIADRVVAKGSVPLVPPALEGEDVGGDVVLIAPRAAPWVDALEEVLGAGKVKRLASLTAWREEQAEADPDAGTPLAEGLKRLRREARLLKSQLLGRLAPTDLGELVLRKGGGKVAVRYDAQRKVGVLDVEHPLVERALREARLRPERMYVLLAALYGCVNRALERFTDEDEAKLLAALVSHLAANPQLLEPS